LVNRRMRTAVTSWEEKEGEGECKNQIRRPCHHWDKGRREDLMIATLGRDDTHANSAMCAYMVLADVQLAAGEGGGAAQDAVEDDGGGMVVKEERIAARIATMLMGMGMGMVMGIGNADAMMQSQ
jgi:hypothetical protein